MTYKTIIVSLNEIDRLEYAPGNDGHARRGA
jgi:hypothetical protein